MSETLFSPHWYRVCNLKPLIRQHVEVHRNDYRGLIWYILEDKASGRSHRFNSTAYQVIGLLDGQLTVNQIWDLVSDRLGDFAPTQEQMIQLLGKLHAADLLQSGLPADTEELFQRGKEHKSNKFKQRYSNPLSVKVPLWDPENFLQRHLSKVSWLFHWQIGLIWLLVISAAALATAINWQAISTYFTINTLSPYNLIIMGILYPLIKVLHELGHAFSAKYEGGEVHEMGVTFLMFMPIPYVDVSTVNFLRSKHQRILVSAAGILVELFIAAVGLFLWLSVESGVVKDIAFNMMIIGGISSLFFNGNPLLKYDGYYILADALAIPNLFQRSTQYLSYLTQKHVFGVTALSSPATAPGESGWFVLYSISSFIYRLGLLWFIVVYVTDSFFVIGVLLALLAVGRQILLPIIKGLVFVFNSPSIHRQRFRAVASLTGTLLVLFVILYWVPVPAYTRSEGVIWMPEEAQLRAEVDGFAGDLMLELPATVKKDTVVIEIYDPLLNTRVEVLFANLKELNSKFRAEWDNDRIKADNIKEEMLVVAAELKYAKRQQQAMQIMSNKAGKLLIPYVEDLTGRFLRKGEIVGYVIDDALPIVRVVVAQSNIGQIQQQVKAVQVRLVNHPSQVIPATIIRRSPEATNYLPSAALATINGGKIPIDPDFKEELKTQEKVFQIDLEFNPSSQITKIGQRVYVRFDHGSESLGQQWYRSLRQVFLRQFNV
jgi:putative peptide zinc metalloprotease protein